MASPQSGYSRGVRVLKIGLPILAICLLGTVFLVTSPDRLRGPGPVFTEADRESLAEGLNILQPRIEGSTDGGDFYVLTANRIIAEDGQRDVMLAEDIDGEIRQVSGRTIVLAGRSGRVDFTTKRWQLTGGATLSTTDHYAARAEELLGDMAAGIIESPGPVLTTGPGLRIDAGSFRLTFASDGTPGRTVALFDGGIRMTWTPPKP